MLTLNQATTHLNGVMKLAKVENNFLSCVHTYLRGVEFDILSQVRADQFTDHSDIANLLDLQKRVEEQVDRFLRGVL